MMHPVRSIRQLLLFPLILLGTACTVWAQNPLLLRQHSSPILAVAFSGDGKTLVSSAKGGSLVVWDVETGQKRKTLGGHPVSVIALALSPDGSILATGSGGGKVRLYQRKDGRLLAKGTAVRGPVRMLAFSPDGKTLAAGGGVFASEGSIVLLDAATCKPELFTRRFVCAEAFSLLG